jgi:CDP-6-deoxy-D-xylo-4-hexulose-3-dehydrase
MDKLNHIVESRNKNYLKYKEGIKNNFWNISPTSNSYVSNFSYPIITKNLDKLIFELQNNNIECRPLICGSINEHPFWYERYGKQELPNSKLVHEYGLYLPNNHQMTEEEINKVIEIVNKNI